MSREFFVFDLDNTLYPASLDVFHQIDKRMKAFIAERLKLSLEEAFVLQKTYYRKYGTTLRGLMLCHEIEPESFLAYVHDIDHSTLPVDSRLNKALKELQGQKFIFTNGSETHAVKVLDRLGISQYFDGIFDIKMADYIPKPSPETYRRLVKKHAIKANHAVMFEDLAVNLRPASAIGMLAVWINGLGGEVHPNVSTDHIDQEINDINLWLEAWNNGGMAAVKKFRHFARSPALSSLPEALESGSAPGPEPTRHGDWHFRGRCSDF